MNDEAKRHMIATLLRAGRSVRDVVKDTGLSKTTVYKVQKLVKWGKDLKEGIRTGRPKKVDVNEVKEIFLANPKTPMATVAKNMDVNKSTIHRAVKKGGGISLRMIERPLLSQIQRDKRLDYYVFYKLFQIFRVFMQHPVFVCLLVPGDRTTISLTNI